MKRTIFSLCLLATSLCSWAQGHENTTDHLTISEIKLNPGAPVGDNDFITISIEGSRKYATFGADIYLPAGYEWAKDSYGETAYISIDGTMFSVGRGGVISSHAVGYNLQEDGAMRVTVYPTGTGDMSFKENSGALIDIYVKATSYAKPGPAAIQIKHCYFSTEAGVQYDTEDITIDDKVSASASSSLPFSVSSSAHWGTCILPFNAELPAGVKAYTSENYDEENIYLDEAESLEAYTPYILYSETGYSGKLSGIVDPAGYPESGSVTKGILSGAVVSQNLTEGFILQNLSSGVMFYPIKEGQTFNLPAGKCWMNIPAAANARGMNFVVAESSGIKNFDANIDNSTVYNMQGMKIGKEVPGNIYIKNGKKHISK